MSLLEKETDLINNIGIKTFTKEALEGAPPYFWIIPSSTSGRFHPIDTVGKGGLIEHTKRVFYVARHIGSALCLSSIEIDILSSAALLHDTLKQGWPDEGRIIDEHPFLVRGYYKHLSSLTNAFNDIMDVIEEHAGVFSNPAVYPSHRISMALYLADYLSSRIDVYIIKNGFKPDFSKIPYLIVKKELIALLNEYFQLKFYKNLCEKDMKKIKKKIEQAFYKEDVSRLITPIGVVREQENRVVVFRRKKDMLEYIQKHDLVDELIYIDKNKFLKLLRRGVIEVDEVKDFFDIVKKQTVKIQER